MVYTYKSLFNRPTFVQGCELQRSKPEPSSVPLTVLDYKVWQNFQLRLHLPNNLCLKLNLDWFNQFQYSVGVPYFLVDNSSRKMVVEFQDERRQKSQSLR